jgi:deoxyadenosine/deoxycytidine kinase
VKRYLVLAGNIGAGKSTLVDLLCQRLGWTPYYEPVAENPYLKDFYADMERWAFHSQTFFLMHRARSHRSLSLEPGSVVQDRSMYEDAEVFARNLFMQGRMSARDYQVYRDLYQVFASLLPTPDLVVYLRASVPTLRRRIAQRARSYEQDIPEDYLQGLNLLYEDWIGSFQLAPVLAIETDRTDLLGRPQDLEEVVSRIEDALREGQGELRFPGV